MVKLPPHDSYALLCTFTATMVPCFWNLCPLQRTLVLPLPQVDVDGCCLVVTTGGTGPAPRDVTPEATEAVCDRMMPGYGEQMRAISLKYVPTAVLSRQTAGTVCDSDIARAV